MKNMHPTAPSFIYNGRFATQKTTGVQRVARELIAALGHLPGNGGVTVVVPPQPELQSVDGTHLVKIGFGKGVFWEQLVLPVFAGRHRIVNLSNSASIFRLNQVIYMHDAAVFDVPAHFSRRFRAWYRFMFWILARTSSCVVTNSDFSRQRLAHHCAVPAERISVVPLGADHLDAITPDASVLQEYGLESKRFVLAVSNMNPTKNFGRILESFRQLNDPSIDLVIVGMKNASVFGDVQDMRAIAPNIKAVGYLNDQKLKALYQHAHCFVYPSIYEGFGIPPLEAMRCGCPVIVGRSSALPETCGDAALYCDPYSSEDIADKMRTLLLMPEVRSTMIERGYSHAARFRWDTSAEMLRQVIHRSWRNA